jgi:hypothetical protein
MPDLIRHPEDLKSTGFRLEFIPMKIGAGMTTFVKTVVYGQTLIKTHRVTFLFSVPLGDGGNPSP